MKEVFGGSGYRHETKRTKKYNFQEKKKTTNVIHISQNIVYITLKRTLNEQESFTSLFLIW